MAYDVDAQAFIDAVVGGGDSLSTIQQDAIDSLVTGLKTNGTWSKYKAIYPFIGGTASAHKWNLKDPQDTDGAFRLTFTGGTHSSSGFTTDKSLSEYADTKFVPDTENTDDLISMGFYQGLTTASNDAGDHEFGALGGSWATLQYNQSDFKNPEFSTGEVNVTIAGTSDKGYMAGSRLSSTSNVAMKIEEGATLATNTNTASVTLGLPNVALSIGALDTGNFANIQAQFAWVGSGHTLQELQDDYDVIETYQDSLGRGLTNDGFESEYSTVISEATQQGYTLPSADWQVRQNQMIVAAKANGIWNSLDCAFVFTGDGGSDFKLINWKDPSGTKATEVGGGALIWDSGGVEGDNSNYIDTGFNTSTSPVNYLQNDAGVYIDLVELSDGSNRQLYSNTGGTSTQFASDTSLMRPKINSDGSLGPLFTIDNKGLYGASRNNATQQIHSLETANSTVSHNSGALENETITLFTGTSIQRGTQKVGFLLLSSDLSAQQQEIIDSFRRPYFEIEYQDVINEAILQGYGLPTMDEQINQNAILADLKTRGVWAELDSFTWFKQSGDSDFKSIDWKDPTGTKATIEVGVTFDTDGAIGNNSAGINVANRVSNYLIDDAGITVEVVSEQTEGVIILDADSPTVQMSNSSTLQYMNSSGTSTRDTKNFSGTGVFGLNMLSGNFDGYNNGVSFDNSTETPVQVPTGAFEIFGSGANAGDMTVGFLAYGSAYSQADLYDAVNLYQAPGGPLSLASDITPSSATAADASLDSNLTASTAGSSTTVAGATIKQSLEVSDSTSSTTVADLTIGTTTQQLEASVSGSTTTAADGTIRVSALVTDSTSSTVIGDVDITSNLEASTSGSSLVTGDLTIGGSVGQLQASISGSSSVDGDATIKSDLSVSDSASSSVTSNATIKSGLSVSDSASSSVAGNLTFASTNSQVQASISGSSSVTADADASESLSLSASISGGSVSTGYMISLKKMSVAINPSSELSGSLSSGAVLDLGSTMTLSSTMAAEAFAPKLVSCEVDGSSAFNANLKHLLRGEKISVPLIQGIKKSTISITAKNLN